ncbi:hypothetical protein CHS0354_032695 [Potamilus streckersoni]|uniref:B30.2/SPRY domain-containing protein n=1 Tax=Potamilus streckersoni TaxID=2493646 RepID=A0AAE0RQH2_9BIVA|nr:hypothetical protein CHS0354_032695 [Potamilus streckersoni]
MEVHGFSACSDGIIITGPTSVMRFRQGNQEADGARWSIGLEHGKHVFEIVWPDTSRGTYATIGVGSLHTPLHRKPKTSLIGMTESSLGLDIVRKRIIYNGEPKKTYPTIFHVPEKFLMYVDCDSGKLSFGADECFWGIAFENIDRQMYPLHIMAGLTEPDANIQIFYKGSAIDSPYNMAGPSTICAPGEYSLSMEIPELPTYEQASATKENIQPLKLNCAPLRSEKNEKNNGDGHLNEFWLCITHEVKINPVHAYNVKIIPVHAYNVEIIPVHAYNVEIIPVLAYNVEIITVHAYNVEIIPVHAYNVEIISIHAYNVKIIPVHAYNVEIIPVHAYNVEIIPVHAYNVEIISVHAYNVKIIPVHAYNVEIISVHAYNVEIIPVHAYNVEIIPVHAYNVEIIPVHAYNVEIIPVHAYNVEISIHAYNVKIIPVHVYNVEIISVHAYNVEIMPVHAYNVKIILAQAYNVEIIPVHAYYVEIIPVQAYKL